jgi:hypothetical protein
VVSDCGRGVEIASGSWLQADRDVVLPGTLISIGNDTVEYLIQRYVQGYYNPVREVVVRSEAIHQRRHPRDPGHVVGDLHFNR